MATLFIYAEIVRRLMRSIQHLSINDVDGVDDASRYLGPVDVDDEEVASRLSSLRMRVEAVGSEVDVMTAIDELASYAETLLEAHLAKIRSEPMRFAIEDREFEDREFDCALDGEPCLEGPS